jgi:hypothetical protein
MALATVRRALQDVESTPGSRSAGIDGASRTRTGDLLGAIHSSRAAKNRMLNPLARRWQVALGDHLRQPEKRPVRRLDDGKAPSGYVNDPRRRIPVRDLGGAELGQ